MKYSSLLLYRKLIQLYIYIFLLWFMTRYWIEFPVPYCRISFLFILYKNRLHLLIPNSQSFPPWQPQACSLCLWVSSCFTDMFLLESTYGWYHMKTVFLFLSTSLNMLISRSIHVAASGIILCFKCVSSIPFSLCINTCIFFIHWSVDGHLVCSHVLATVGCAAINTGVHECFQDVVLFHIYAWECNYWIIRKVCFLFFWGSSILFSTMAQSAYTPPTV